MGKVIDIDKAGIGAFQHELKRECIHQSGIGKVYAAAGNADIARKHSEGIDKTDGQTALHMTLQAVAAPDMGRMILCQQIRQKSDGLGGHSGGIQQPVSRAFFDRGKEFVRTSDLMAVIRKPVVLCKFLQQQDC